MSTDEVRFLEERIGLRDTELVDARKVIDALFGVVLGRIEDRECVDACRQLVANYQERWGPDRDPSTNGDGP
jgi:hypothetical protein